MREPDVDEIRRMRIRAPATESARLAGSRRARRPAQPDHPTGSSRKPASPSAAAEQAIAYLADGRAALGVLPTQDTLVLERFFDESGGMQLVLHAPFGSRINKAWSLALRKRFCRQFNFELQAAATEDALLLSLGPQHSFPLADVFRYLHPATTRDVLVQAFLDAPVFQTRWRWNTTISLAVPRNRGGKKVPPQLQRMLADDLMAAVFPDAAACLENIPGDREIPDHPLVSQAVRDCLEEAMDFDGAVRACSRGSTAATIRCVARDTPEPSRARARDPQRPAVRVPGRCAARGAADAGGLRAPRRRAVRRRRPRRARRRRDRARPRRSAPRSARRRRAARRAAERRVPDRSDDARDDRAGARSRRWPKRVARANSRIPNSEFRILRRGGAAAGVARRPSRTRSAIRSIEPPPSRAARVWTRDEAIVELLRGRVAIVGPTTARALAEAMGIDVADADAALLALEGEGVVLRGRFQRKTAKPQTDGCAACELCVQRNGATAGCWRGSIATR